MTSRIFGTLWSLWLISFCVIEYFGAASGRHQTLSEWTWYCTTHPVLRFPLAGFLIWLFVHLVFKVRA